MDRQRRWLRLLIHRGYTETQARTFVEHYCERHGFRFML